MAGIEYVGITFPNGLVVDGAGDDVYINNCTITGGVTVTNSVQVAISYSVIISGDIIITGAAQAAVQSVRSLDGDIAISSISSSAAVWECYLKTGSIIFTSCAADSEWDNTYGPSSGGTIDIGFHYPIAATPIGYGMACTFGPLFDLRTGMTVALMRG